MYVPDELKISKDKYEKMLTHCKKCEKDFNEKLNRNRFNFENSIHFDLYYWSLSYSSDNWYAKHHEEGGLCQKFKCDSKDLLTVAKNIGMNHIIELSTYHAVWSHYFYHKMDEGDNSNSMEEWDSMMQPQHVHSKNELHFMINLLLTCPDRVSMMKEIRDFSMCPPISKNGVGGHEYREAKATFEKYQKM
jgi:hypothetical protein